MVLLGVAWFIQLCSRYHFGSCLLLLPPWCLSLLACGNRLKVGSDMKLTYDSPVDQNDVVEAICMLRLQKGVHIVVETVYCVCILPAVFNQYPFVDYDMAPCLLLALSVGSSVAIMQLLYVYTTSAVDLEATARAWGLWVACRSSEALEREFESAPTWQRGMQYSRGSYVKYKGGLYESLTHNTLAEPGHWIPYIVHVLFGEPLVCLKRLMVVECIVVCAQFLVMAFTRSCLPIFTTLVWSCIILWRTVCVKRATALKLQDMVDKKLNNEPNNTCKGSLMYGVAITQSRNAKSD